MLTESLRERWDGRTRGNYIDCDLILPGNVPFILYVEISWCGVDEYKCVVDDPHGLNTHVITASSKDDALAECVRYVRARHSAYLDAKIAELKHEITRLRGLYVG